MHTHILTHLLPGEHAHTPVHKHLEGGEERFGLRNPEVIFYQELVTDFSGHSHEQRHVSNCSYPV